MLLSQSDLDRLRSVPSEICSDCHQTIRKNYCRQCDEFFWDEHDTECTQWLEHSQHRTYRNFDVVVENSLGDKLHAWAKEAINRAARDDS